ncbi:MAG: leucyl aminopeptidase family protein [Xanthomonadales bacterium]
MAYQSVSGDISSKTVITLIPLKKSDFNHWLQALPQSHRQWVEVSGFMAKPGQFCTMPGEGEAAPSCVFGMQKDGWLTQLAAMPAKLPKGIYRLQCDWNQEQRLQASLGWGLGAYCFDRYKKKSKPQAELLLDDDIDEEVRALCDAQCLVRDLVNTPTEHMGPQQLADAVTDQADRYDADCDTIVGQDLLTRNYPAIHIVGRASDREPRLIRMTWGDEAAPLLALVGKGVCFDTGGLDLKSATGMAHMKKDMGGGAHALALARLVMQHKLPVRLLLLIPAVENSVAGNAYRPGDVIETRKGLSVEIGNTDAEGRVVLSDALAYASEQLPDLVIDFATLTGAARIAMGTELTPLFSNHLEVARAIQEAGDEVEDPMWTMPLYQPYRKLIESPIADLNNTGKTSFGGCITAALFLEHFVEAEIPWVHIDTFAWNQADRPGRPQGGEALGLRAVFRYLQSRYN